MPGDLLSWSSWTVEEEEKWVAEGRWKGTADHVTSCLVLSSPNLSVLTNHLF